MRIAYASLLLVAACSDSSSSGADARPTVDSAINPGWKVDAPLDAFIAIPGSEGAGGAAIDAYSGFTLREDTSELFILAAGGHGDSSDNRVVSLDLREDAPTWVMRSAPSTEVTVNASYYPDGKPASSHLYDYTAWVPNAGGTGRYMRIGMFGRYGDGGQNPNVDGFDPITNTWDPAGTYPDVPNGGNSGTARDKKTNVVYTQIGHYQWTASATAWTATTGLEFGRFPIAYDTKREGFFSLQYGDGQGYDPQRGVVAMLASPATSSTRTITFAPSSAYSQFIEDEPTYAGMDYDQANDVFLFFSGQSLENGTVTNVPSRVYVVTPSESDTWTMKILELGTGGVVPDPPPQSGIQGRFKYVPALGGFIYMAHGSAPLYFLRTM